MTTRAFLGLRRLPGLSGVGALLLAGTVACSGTVAEEDGPMPGKPKASNAAGGNSGEPSTTGTPGGGTPGTGTPNPANPGSVNPSPMPPTTPGMPVAMGPVTNLSDSPLAGRCKAATVGRARLWRLSQTQLRNTLKAALGIDASTAQLAAFNDGNAGFIFGNEVDALRIRKADANSWAVTVLDLSRTAAASLKKTNVCPDMAAPGCAPVWADAAALKLFRRPLRDTEKARYTKLYTDTLATPMAGGDGAGQAVLSAMLQSPYFLYRTEIGKPVAGKKGLARLTGYELASALSYTLWQTSPDDLLMKAAAAGELDTPEGVRKNAQRLIDDARFVTFYTNMLADLTRGSQMAAREGAEQVKDSAIVMGWLQAELQSFITGVVAEKPTLDELLTRRKISVVGDTVAYRALGAGKGAAAVSIDLPAPVAGVLSLGALQFANAGTERPSPVKRGVMVREHFLCTPVPPPPENVKMDFAMPGGDVVTNRQVYEKTTALGQCAGCHSLFNPIGYAFEAFDQTGKYRTTDKGKPVDASGTIVGTRDANIKFANLTELATGLAAAPQVAECFVLNGFRYVSGRLENDGDLCGVAQIHDAFVKGGKNLKTLAIDLVAADAFALRTIE